SVSTSERPRTEGKISNDLESLGCEHSEQKLQTKKTKEYFQPAAAALKFKEAGREELAEKFGLSLWLGRIESQQKKKRLNVQKILINYASFSKN
ncbi:hypothetical protein AVEN_210306-1, partial [Araneus ventricosus]